MRLEDKIRKAAEAAKPKLKEAADGAIIVCESWLDDYLAWLVSLPGPWTSIAVFVHACVLILIGYSVR